MSIQTAIHAVLTCVLAFPKPDLFIVLRLAVGGVRLSSSGPGISQSCAMAPSSRGAGQSHPQNWPPRDLSGPNR